MDWTSDDVLARLIEAVDVIEDTTDKGPRLSTGNSWPAYLHEFSDLAGWPKEWRQETWDRWGRERRFEPGQIARADEAMGWISDIPDDARRKTVLIYAYCVAKNKPFGPFLEKNAWKRRTFYDRLNKTLQKITTSLCLVGVIRHEAEEKYVAQIDRKRGMSTTTVARSASHWSGDSARPLPEDFGTDPDPNAWAAEQARRRKRKEIAAGMDAA